MSKITVSWTTYAKLSYFEELDFIQLKWTSKEVNAFALLVEFFVENLSKGTIQGKKHQQSNVYSTVISKQTTVFYKTYPKKNSVALLLFWNNKKNPDLLKRKLQKFM